MGTFDDLSDEEKTRALLQFLQHHQQLERENENKPFQDSVSNHASIPISRTIDLLFKLLDGHQVKLSLVIQSP